jgi:hypothetical protein
MNPEQYVAFIDEQLQQSDYAGPENDIMPAADPQATAMQERQTKLQGLMQLLALGTLDPMQVTAYALDVLEIPDYKKFMIQKPPAPPPDPKVEAMKAQTEMKGQELQMKGQESQMKMQLAQTQAQHKIEIENAKAQLAVASEEQKMQIEAQMKAVDIEYKKLEAVLKAREANASHQQKMQQGAESHALNMITKAEAAKNKGSKKGD